MQLSEHPTVIQIRAREATDAAQPRPESLDREWLRKLCLEAGADDASSVPALLRLTLARLGPAGVPSGGAR